MNERVEYVFKEITIILLIIVVKNGRFSYVLTTYTDGFNYLDLYGENNKFNTYIGLQN